MRLESYIKDLLYRYDCVIVPNFGGFISNRKSANINDNTFNPPYKQLTFNSLIQNNDGLLANHIASTDKMPYETALNFINFEVETWSEKLMDNDLDLHGIGTFTMENDTILFEPNTAVNFLTDAFGLTSYVSDAVYRKKDSITKEVVLLNQPAIYREQVAIIDEKAVIPLTTPKRKTANFLKYAAIFVIGSSIVGLLGTKMYQENSIKKQIANLQQQQEARENQIQTATFVLSSPLPSITLEVNDDVKIEKYHIIAGAFRNRLNANKKVRQLKRKGINAKIIGKNKWNLTQVAFQSFSDLEEATLALTEFKRRADKNAWLLIK